MSALPSMLLIPKALVGLVPMDTRTLPGWPTAPSVSALDEILLLIVPAVAAFVLFTVIGKVGHQIHVKRGGHDYDEDVATREGRIRGVEGGGSGARAALPSEQSGSTWVDGDAPETAGRAQSVEADSGSAPAEANKVGGARARW